MISPSKKPLPHDKGTAPVPDLEQQVRELNEQVKKLTDIAGRAQADLQNAKVRMERDRAELSAFAAEALLKKLLPTIDNFQRAFQNLPDELRAHEWVKGVAAIEQEFMQQLTALGLKPMQAFGQHFDSARHEALSQGPGEEGIVTEVFEEGYELHGKVLRPAKVRVGMGGEPPSKR